MMSWGSVESRYAPYIVEPRDITRVNVPPDRFIILQTYYAVPPEKPGCFYFSPGVAEKVYAAGIVGPEDVWTIITPPGGLQPNTTERPVAFLNPSQLLASDSSFPANPLMQETFLGYTFDELNQIGVASFISMLRRLQQRRDDQVIAFSTSRGDIERRMQIAREGLTFARLQYATLQDFFSLCLQRNFEFANCELSGQLQTEVTSGLELVKFVL